MRLWRFSLTLLALLLCMHCGNGGSQATPNPAELDKHANKLIYELQRAQGKTYFTHYEGREIDIEALVIFRRSMFDFINDQTLKAGESGNPSDAKDIQRAKAILENVTSDPLHGKEPTTLGEIDSILQDDMKAMKNAYEFPFIKKSIKKRGLSQ